MPWKYKLNMLFNYKYVVSWKNKSTMPWKYKCIFH